MNRPSIRSWIPLAALLALTTLGCAGGSAPAPGERQDPANGPAIAGRPLDGRSDAASNDETSGEQQQPGAEQPGSEQQPAQAADGALVIHTGTLDLEVADLRRAVEQATALIRGLGGNVGESHETNADGRHTASVTYRIPAARWEEAVAGLRGIGQRVVTENIEAQDVTTQVVDLDARIANLRSTEAALQGIMVDATTITDVLKVQAELTKVRSDIESMTAQRDHLADRATLGTLEVRFGGPVMATTAATQGWDLGHEIDSAVAALVKLGQGLASVAVWTLIVFLPVAIPVVGIFVAAVWLRRRYAARRPVAATFE